MTHDDWMDAFFASYYAHRPVNATFIGVHDFDHRLPDFFDAGVGDVLADARRLLDATPDPDAELDRIQAMDQRLARGFLEIQKWECTSGHFQEGNPSLYTGEATCGILGLFLTDFAPMGERLEAATARMAAIPYFLAQGTRQRRERPEGLDRARDAGVRRRPRPFHGRCARLAADISPAVRSCAQGRAFSHHKTWLATQLVAHDRYSCGPEALDLYLRRGHFLEEDADEIARAAESALAEAESYLAAHATDFGAANPEGSDHSARRRRAVRGGLLRPLSGDPGRDPRTLKGEDSHHPTGFSHPLRAPPEWTRETASHLYFLHYRSQPLLLSTGHPSPKRAGIQESGSG